MLLAVINCMNRNCMKGCWGWRRAQAGLGASKQRPSKKSAKKRRQHTPAAQRETAVTAASRAVAPQHIVLVEAETPGRRSSASFASEASPSLRSLRSADHLDTSQAATPDAETAALGAGAVPKQQGRRNRTKHATALQCVDDAVGSLTAENRFVGPHKDFPCEAVHRREQPERPQQVLDVPPSSTFCGPADDGGARDSTEDP